MTDDLALVREAEPERGGSAVPPAPFDFVPMDDHFHMALAAVEAAGRSLHPPQCRVGVDDFTVAVSFEAGGRTRRAGIRVWDRPGRFCVGVGATPAETAERVVAEIERDVAAQTKWAE